MSNRQDNRVCVRRGVAFVITLIFLSLFACLAVAIAATADSNLTIARNRIAGQQASAFAATGIQMMQFNLGGMPAGHAIDASHMNTLIYSHLTNVHSMTVDPPDTNGVTLPTITLKSADGRDGTVDVTIHATSDGKTVIITSVAHYPVDPDNPDAPAAKRSAMYRMGVQKQAGHLPPFGVASKGIVSAGGNAVIRGDVLSAYYRPPGATVSAVRVDGSAKVYGDVNAVDDWAGAIYEKKADSIIGAKVTGVVEPVWPEVDITPFTDYVLATSEGWKDYDGNPPFSNIRIPPNAGGGKGLTISNKDIKGVVYIQSPNKVTFSGDTTITGVIVADPPDVDNLTDNVITFTGNTSISGVENLSEAKYDGLRALTGSFLLAPGFSTVFKGNFGVVNGCMIASQFAFTGNAGSQAGGTINGGIVNLRDSLFDITGSVDMTINHEGAVEEPAGVVNNRLMCVRGTYVEQE